MMSVEREPDVRHIQFTIFMDTGELMAALDGSDGSPVILRPGNSTSLLLTTADNAPEHIERILTVVWDTSHTDWQQQE